MEKEKIIAVYDNPSAMEPLLPKEAGDLGELALKLVQDSARLDGRLHSITSASVAKLVRSMNSYYSNLIEGHNTHPLDIERALQKNLSIDPAKRALQLESKAHIEVQELVELRLNETPDLNICSKEFLCWIHQEFYKRLPDEFRIVKTKSGKEERVEPGELRKCEVEVGSHIAPQSASLSKFMSRFQEAYDPANLEPLMRVIAAAATHHRLAWIHPFLDGNGRVIRLFTHAYLVRIGISGSGLWTVSRGLARKRDAYMAALSRADAKRWNDYDGRGNLSNAALVEFCNFFLNTCVDQIEFMSSLFDLDTMQQRIAYFGELWARTHKFKDDIVPLLRECFLRGELSRGEAARVMQKPERTTRRLLIELVNEGLLCSEGPGKSIRLGFPIKTVGYYFPKLFPEGVELSSSLEAVANH